MAQVRIVTDSTADISPQDAQRMGITVVPLTLTIDQEQYRDGVDITAEEFYRKLPQAKKFPTTSQPSIGVFQEAYKGLVADGSQVVCITMASKLSGTYNSARMAAESFAPGQVAVIDSTTVTGAEAFFVQTAVEMARLGKSAEQIVTALNAMLPRVQILVVFDTLEYLHKGGRIGPTAALLGGLLNVKPLSQIKDGEVKPLERVRSKAKGLQRIAEMVKNGGKLERICVCHAGTKEEAGELALLVSQVFPLKEISQTYIGPVIGAYAGPKAVGVCLVRAKENG